MTTIKSNLSRTRLQFAFTVDGAEQITKTYGSVLLRPTVCIVTVCRNSSAWFALSPEVCGPRVKKDGTDGQVEVESLMPNHMKGSWPAWVHECVSAAIAAANRAEAQQ